MRTIPISLLSPGDLVVKGGAVVGFILTHVWCDAGMWFVWLLRPDQPEVVKKCFWINPGKLVNVLNDDITNATKRDVC
jgi:hypothetical protein